MRKFLFSLTCIFPLLLPGQKANIDSLKNCLAKEKADSNQVNTLNELAWQLKRSRPKEAYAYAARAAVLAKEIQFQRGTGEAYNNLGNICDNLSKYDSALYYHNLALSVYGKIRYRKGIASSYNNIGEINRSQGHYPEALDFYFKSLAIKKELGDKKSLASTYNNIGITYVSMSDYAKGIEYQLISLRLKEEAGDKARIGSSCQNIGMLYHQLKNDSAALRYTRRSIQLFIESGDSLSLSRALSNEGTMLEAIGKPEEGLRSLQRAMLIGIRLDARKEQLTACNNLVNLYGNIRRFDSAVYYSERALAIATAINDSVSLALINHNLAQIYRNTGQKEKAFTAEKAAEKIARLNGNDRVLRDVCRLMAELYEESGDYKSAFRYRTEHLQLNEKAFNENMARQLNEQQARYESEKKQQLIRDLQQKQRINQLVISQGVLRNQRKNTLIAGLAAALVLLLVSAILFFSRRRAIARMREEKAALEAGERERVRIAKDIHDDLGAGLTRIGMLTRQVSVSNSEEKKSEALNSINSMSLELTENMRDLVWALHPENATLAQLIARIREFSGDFFENTTMQVQSEFPSNVPSRPVSKEMLRGVYLVFKETLNNAARHAEAKTISIRVLIHPNFLEIRIGDDGKGFDPEKARGSGNGLLNMQSRIRQIGGEMKISSEPGKGSVVEFQIPL